MRKRERERELRCNQRNGNAGPFRFRLDQKKTRQSKAGRRKPTNQRWGKRFALDFVGWNRKKNPKKKNKNPPRPLHRINRTFFFFLFQQKKKLEEVEGGAKKRSEFRFRKKKTGNEIERNRTQKKKNWNWPVACSDRQKVDRRETNLITTLNANHQSPEARWDYERVSPVDSTKKIHSERTFWRFERPRGVFHVGSFFFIHFLVPFDYFYQRNVFSVSNNNSRVLRSSKMPYNGRLRAVIANFRIKPMDRNELSNASQM